MEKEPHSLVIIWGDPTSDSSPAKKFRVVIQIPVDGAINPRLRIVFRKRKSGFSQGPAVSEKYQLLQLHLGEAFTPRLPEERVCNSD